MFWFLIIVLSCLYISSVTINYRTRRLLKHLPTFQQLPFLGSLHLFIGGGEKALQILKEISDTIEEKGLPFVLWFAHRPAISVYLLYIIKYILTRLCSRLIIGILPSAPIHELEAWRTRDVNIPGDPEQAKLVGNTFVEKPDYYNFGRIWLGNGLVTTTAKTWKENIKKIGGTFTRSVVNSYLKVFNLQAQKLVEELRKEVDQPPFDGRHYIAHKTLESICQTGLGVTNITDNIATVEYYNAFNKALKIIIRRGMNILYHCEWIFRLTPMYKDLTKQMSVIHSVSNTVIKKRIQEREALKKQTSFNIIKSEQSTFKSFLDILLDLSETDPSLTEYQIKSEVDTVIVGGQETVATTLYFTLLMLGCHPDVQDKLYAEIKEVLGDRRKANKEDLALMVYTEAVLYETLRLFPPFPVVMRWSHRDLQLGPCTVPRGVTLLLNAWGAGRSERSWGSDAEDFIPERWLPPREPCVAACLAFSVGRRACIGKSYAMAILKTMIAHSIREYRFQSEAHSMKLKIDVALRPVSGHHLQVKLRSEKI